ncbi:MAG: patatin family protein, partial [Sphaerochaetaceae bacterium]|nr:patatin family protein [Sphaerochaetaceae bacterium]
MKTGLVLEGGAMRGLFTAGCLDILMENNITFPGAIGVSAGACFGCNVKSKQIGRVLKYNKERAKDPRYASIWSWLFTGDLFNVRFCYDTIPNKLYPFDNDTYRNNPMDFFVVVTDIESGKPVYVNCPSWDDEYYPWMRASASMPLASRVVKINGKGYLDGGIADPIPLKAFKEMGYEKNVVILTQPEDYVKGPNSLQSVMKVLLRKYPALVEDMRIRHELYNRETAFVK